MARTLKLDVLVDDHGGVRTLRNVADAERSIAHEATGASTALSSLGTFVSRAAAAFAGFIVADVALRGLRATVEFATRAAFGMNAELETSTLQFETLMGSSARAEAHVKSLFEFAKRTPFETGPIIEASRILQVFGGDALNTMETLQLLGDTAAATAAPIDELARWTGRLYAALQGGQPVGEATRRLMELGVISPQAVEQMRALAESSGGASKAFAFFTEELGKNEGAMAKQANTWKGLTSTFVEGAQLAMAEAFEPLFELVKSGLSTINQMMGSEGFQGAVARFQATLTDALPTAAQMMTGLISALGFLVEAAQASVQALNFLWIGILRGAEAILNLTTTAFEGAKALLQVAIALDPLGTATEFYTQLLFKLAITQADVEAGAISLRQAQDRALTRYTEGSAILTDFSEILRSSQGVVDAMTASHDSAATAVDSHANAVTRLTTEQLRFAEDAMPKSLNAMAAFMSQMVTWSTATPGGIGFNPSDWIVDGVPFTPPTSVPQAGGGPPAGVPGGGGGYGGGYPMYGGGGGGGGQGPYFLPDYGKPVYGAGGLLGYQSQTTPVGSGTTVNIDAKGAIFESDAVLTRLADQVASKLAGRYGQGALI